MLTKSGGSSTKFVLWFTALPRPGSQARRRRNFACVPRFYRVSKSAPARPFLRLPARPCECDGGAPRCHCFPCSVGGGGGKCKSVFYFSFSGASERRTSVEGRPTAPQATDSTGMSRNTQSGSG